MSLVHPTVAPSAPLAPAAGGSYLACDELLDHVDTVIGAAAHKGEI